MPGIVGGEISRNMRGSLIILATCFAACVAVCRPGLNGRNDWYRCEGLNEISVRTCSTFLLFLLLPFLPDNSEKRVSSVSTISDFVRNLDYFISIRSESKFSFHV